MKKKIDKYDMKKVIMDFPKQFPVGLDVAKNIRIFGDLNQLIFCGMGGSALPGAILKMLQIFYGWPINIRIHRSYGLPTRLSPRSLIFAVSYSGNTEETISSYQEAKEKNLSVVGISTNGKLAELCKKDKNLWVKLPKAKIQPRSAVGFQFASIVKLLSNSNIIEDLDEEILDMSKFLKPKALEKQGKELALKIKGKIPIIYASDKYRTLAQIWKINFNENSKSPAFWNYFPEVNHNEMEGMSRTTLPFHVLILRDKKLDHPRILKRMTTTAQLLKEKGIKVDTIDIQGPASSVDKLNVLTKVFSNYILANWTSYYLALEYETDPSPVKTVEEFKKRLG
jgi:glucose/mannose-6-phosphate isomerase